MTGGEGIWGDSEILEGEFGDNLKGGIFFYFFFLCVLDVRSPFLAFSFPLAGVHRQVLFTTVGWFAGYFLAKRTEYVHAKKDREMFEYIRHHPEDFKTEGWYFGKDLSLP